MSYMLKANARVQPIAAVFDSSNNLSAIRFAIYGATVPDYGIPESVTRLAWLDTNLLQWEGTKPRVALMDIPYNLALKDVATCGECFGAFFTYSPQLIEETKKYLTICGLSYPYINGINLPAVSQDGVLLTDHHPFLPLTADVGIKMDNPVATLKCVCFKDKHTNVNYVVFVDPNGYLSFRRDGRIAHPILGINPDNSKLYVFGTKFGDCKITSPCSTQNLSVDTALELANITCYESEVVLPTYNVFPTYTVTLTEPEEPMTSIIPKQCGAIEGCYKGDLYVGGNIVYSKLSGFEGIYHQGGTLWECDFFYANDVSIARDININAVSIAQLFLPVRDSYNINVSASCANIVFEPSAIPGNRRVYAKITANKLSDEVKSYVTDDRLLGIRLLGTVLADLELDAPNVTLYTFDPDQATLLGTVGSLSIDNLAVNMENLVADTIRVSNVLVKECIVSVKQCNTIELPLGCLGTDKIVLSGDIGCIKFRCPYEGTNFWLDTFDNGGSSLKYDIPSLVGSVANKKLIAIAVRSLAFLAVSELEACKKRNREVKPKSVASWVIYAYMRILAQLDVTDTDIRHTAQLEYDSIGEYCEVIKPRCLIQQLEQDGAAPSAIADAIHSAISDLASK